MSSAKFNSRNLDRRRWMHVTSGVLMLLSLPLRVFAANAAGYTLDHVGTEYGLPRSSIRAIAQDPSGFIWVGTESGLHRFDGLKFDNFEPPFGRGVVNSIAIDSRGRIWTSWFTNPTTIYDPYENKWKIIRVMPPRTLPLGFVEDTSGTIWLADGSTLFRYDERTNEAVAVLQLDYEIGSLVRQDLVFESGTIWLPEASGILGYDTLTDQVSDKSLRNVTPPFAIVRTGTIIWSCHVHQIFRKEPGGQFKSYYENQSVEINSCAHDKTGNLWLGTSIEGVMEIDSKRTVRRYRHDGSDVAGAALNRVTKILVDEQGRPWIVSPRQVSIFSDGEFSDYTYNPMGPRSGPTRQLELQIVEDNSGVVWLGTNNSGLARLSRYSKKFRSAIPPADDTRSNKPVLDRFDNLWIGMRRGGVYRWNRQQDTWRNYSANIDDATQLPTDFVRVLLSTMKDELYAGSEVGILSRYEREIDGWKRIDLGGETPIYSLLELPDHRIVAGRRGSLTIYDIETSSVNQISVGDGAQVHATTHSSDGSLWIGTHGGAGLMRLDPGQGLMRSWPGLFGGLKVSSLHEDKLGIVWIGTWGNGLLRFNPFSEQIESVVLDNERIDHTIASILPGVGNDLWVGGDKGLSRIQNCETISSVCDVQVMKFNLADGLVNRWFGADSFSVAKNGELFVGGSNGIDFFHPSSFEKNPVPPQVNFTEVLLNGETVRGKPSLDRNYDLPHEFGELEVRFAATDFHDSGKNSYRYRIDGRDAWVDLKNANRIILRNLQSGTHRLEILGSNNSGVWSLNPIRMTIAVASPIYARWWAITMYCFLLIAAALVANRYRERRGNEYKARLESEVEERTRDLHKANRAMTDFYANVSHEVRTPLALIYSAVDQLQDVSDPDGTKLVFSAIRRHTRSLSRFVDGLITVSQLRNSPDPQWGAVDASANLVQIVRDFEPLANRREVKFELAQSGKIMVRTQANALSTIFSNLIVNAIKHATDGGVIRITASSDQSTAHFTFEDDGPGIEPEVRQKIFDRGALYSNVSGYGIGLYLVRQIVSALGGCVIAEESDLGGACFRASIPVAEDSLPLIRLPEIGGPLEIGRQQFDTANNLPSKSDTKPTILVVEDNEELRGNICDFLSASYNVLDTDTVQETLQIAIEEVPDIVLCDIMLPDGSGFDVVRRIKGDLVTDHIPIVVMTALADEENRMKGLEYRADAYLTKPFERDVLKLTLSNLVHSRRSILRHAGMRAWRENLNESTTENTTEQRFIRRLASAMNESYSDPGSDIAVVAEKIAMSRRALERKTRQYLDRTPNELLTEYRLQRASHLLVSGARVVNVSLECGFGSPSHFGAVFKKHFACTPREYAKRNRPKS